MPLLFYFLFFGLPRASYWEHRDFVLFCRILRRVAAYGTKIWFVYSCKVSGGLVYEGLQLVNHFLVVMGFLSKVVLRRAICYICCTLSFENLLARYRFVMTGCVRSVDRARFWGLLLYSLYLFCRLARANRRLEGFYLYFNLREVLTFLLSRMRYFLFSGVTSKFHVQVWFEKVTFARWFESLFHSLSWLIAERVSFLFKIWRLSIQRMVSNLALHKLEVNWFSLWLLAFIVLIVISLMYLA